MASWGIVAMPFRSVITVIATVCIFSMQRTITITTYTVTITTYTVPITTWGLGQAVLVVGTNDHNIIATVYIAVIIATMYTNTHCTNTITMGGLR